MAEIETYKVEDDDARQFLSAKLRNAKHVNVTADAVCTACRTRVPLQLGGPVTVEQILSFMQMARDCKCGNSGPFELHSIQVNDGSGWSPLGAQDDNASPRLPPWVKEGAYVFDYYVGTHGRNVRVAHRNEETQTFGVEHQNGDVELLGPRSIGTRIVAPNAESPEGIPCVACGLARNVDGHCHGCWTKVRARALRGLSAGSGGRVETVDLPGPSRLRHLVSCGVDSSRRDPFYRVGFGSLLESESVAFDSADAAAAYFADLCVSLATTGRAVQLGCPSLDPELGRRALRALAEAVHAVVSSRAWATGRIDQLLAEDAKLEPKYARARRMAILAINELHEPWPDRVPGTLADLQEWERERGPSANPPIPHGWQGPDGEPCTAIRVYERSRHLA